MTFLGSHELPLRGDNEGEFSLNKGAFLDTIYLLADNIPKKNSNLNDALGST